MSDHHQHSPFINDSDTALRGSALHQSEAKPQVLSAAKNNMVALPGQPSYNTKIPVCLCFMGKNAHPQQVEAFSAFNFGPN